MRGFLRESYVPVLGLLAVIGAALLLLSNIAGTRSRAPRVVRISAQDIAQREGQPSPSLATGAPLTETMQVVGADAPEFPLADLDGPGSGWVQRAMEMAAHDSLPDALAILTSVLASNPHHGSAWFGVGSILSRQGETHRAIEAYTNAARYSGGRAAALPLYNLGVLQGDVGRTLEAADAFREAIQLRPDYLEARINLAVLLGEREETRAEAMKLYDQLVRLDPSYAEAFYNRGVLWLAAGEQDSAVIDFGRAVAADSSYVKAWYNLGRLASRQGRNEDAVENYRRAILADPTHLKSRHNLSTMLGRLDRYEEAVELGRETVALEPSYVPAWYNLAIALSRTGREAESKRAYERALRLEPDHPRAWQNLGVLLAREGDSRRAIECYREALAIDATGISARYNLALELRRTGDLTGALEQASRLHRLDPEHEKTLSFLSTTARRILEEEPDNTLARQVLAELEVTE